MRDNEDYSGSLHYPEPEFTYKDIENDFGIELEDQLDSLKDIVVDYLKKHKKAYNVEKNQKISHKYRSHIQAQTEQVIYEFKEASNLLETAREYERKIGTDEGFAMPLEERTSVDKIEDSRHPEKVFLERYRCSEDIYRNVVEAFDQEIEDDLTYIEYNNIVTEAEFARELENFETDKGNTGIPQPRPRNRL